MNNSKHIKDVIVIDVEKDNDFKKLPLVLEKYLTIDNYGISYIFNNFQNDIISLVKDVKNNIGNPVSTTILLYAKLKDMITLLEWLPYMAVHHSNFVRNEKRNHEIITAFKNHRFMLFQKLSPYVHQIEDVFNIEVNSLFTNFSFIVDRTTFKDIPIYLDKLINDPSIYDIISSTIIKYSHMELNKSDISYTDYNIQKALAMRQWNEFLLWQFSYLPISTMEYHKKKINECTISIVKFFNNVDVYPNSHKMKFLSENGKTSSYFFIESKKVKKGEELEYNHSFNIKTFYKNDKQHIIDEDREKECCDILKSLKTYKFNNEKKNNNNNSPKKRKREDIVTIICN